MAMGDGLLGCGYLGTTAFFFTFTHVRFFSAEFGLILRMALLPTCFVIFILFVERTDGRRFYARQGVALPYEVDPFFFSSFLVFSSSPFGAFYSEARFGVSAARFSRSASYVIHRYEIVVPPIPPFLPFLMHGTTWHGMAHWSFVFIVFVIGVEGGKKDCKEINSYR